MTTDSAESENGHNDDIPASPPRTTSERTAKPGHQQPSTTQAGFRAIPGEASPRRTGLSNCSVCDTKFTIFEHRHMCQKCQEPVCNRCSRSRKVFRAGTKPKRVCDECVKTFPSATSPRLTGLSNCSVCDTEFTIFEHRHMCQKCQEPVCNRCSRSRKVFRAGTKAKRVCDECVKTFPSATSPRLTGLSNCSVCDTKFTIFEHRHMCQKCQEPVCNRCSRSRKVFRAGTKPKRVCDDCVKTFPSATKIVSDISNTIESGKRSRLTLPASEAANTCAERTMVSPSPVTALFGIGMVGMPSSRKVPPPTPAGGGDNVENKKPDVQTAAATEVKTPPSSSSPPPAQHQDRAQGDMKLVTNGDQGQAESDDKGPDFNSAMSGAAFVPVVAAAEIQEDISNTIESGKRSRLTLPASDAANTCAERTMVSPSPVTALFGIGMVGMPSSRKVPPPTPAGGGDNVENKKPDVQIAAATEVKTPPSSSSPPPAQHQDRAQGDMKLVTNGDQGQAESDDKGPDFNSAMSDAAFVPVVAAAEIQEDISNTIESGKRSRLTLPASDAANTCAERTMVSPSPVTALFGIGMVGMPSSRKVPPPTPAGGGDNVENKKPDVQIAAATEVKTPPSSSSPPPAQHQDRAQGDMKLVTNGDQGQAESDDKGPDFNSAMSGAAFVPVVAAAEIQEDAEGSHAQVINEAADTLDRAVLGLDVSRFLAASSPSIATPASLSTTAILPQDQELVRNEVKTVQTSEVDGALLPAELEVALPAPEKNAGHLKWINIAIQICGCPGTVPTNIVDGTLLPAGLEIALPAPEEHPTENDAKTAASNSASKKWMNVATKICGWGLAAVFVGLEVGLRLLERD